MTKVIIQKEAPRQGGRQFGAISRIFQDFEYWDRDRHRWLEAPDSISAHEAEMPLGDIIISRECFIGNNGRVSRLEPEGPAQDSMKNPAWLARYWRVDRFTAARLLKAIRTFQLPPEEEWRFIKQARTRPVETLVKLTQIIDQIPPPEPPPEGIETEPLDQVEEETEAELRQLELDRLTPQPPTGPGWRGIPIGPNPGDCDPRRDYLSWKSRRCPEFNRALEALRKGQEDEAIKTAEAAARQLLPRDSAAARVIGTLIRLAKTYYCRKHSREIKSAIGRIKHGFMFEADILSRFPAWLRPQIKARAQR